MGKTDRISECLNCIDIEYDKFILKTHKSKKNCFKHSVSLQSSNWIEQKLPKLLITLKCQKMTEMLGLNIISFT